jgi:hypothetical protein
MNISNVTYADITLSYLSYICMFMCVCVKHAEKLAGLVIPVRLQSVLYCRVVPCFTRRARHVPTGRFITVQICREQ